MTNISDSSRKPDDETADFGYRKVPAEHKVEYVLRHFNSIARKYDFMNTLLSFGLHYVWKRHAVEALSVKPGDHVVDVCGGTADLTIRIAPRIGPHGGVYLYDINRAMMEVGRMKIAKGSPSGKIRFMQGDAEQMACRTAQFDGAIVGFGIRNLTHMEKGFEEIFRILKPGGKLICLEFSRPTSFWFRGLYDFYSFYIMPWIGKLFTGHREAYIYLPESIRKFPLQEDLSTLLRSIGFVEVTYRNLTNGIAVIHQGIKAGGRRLGVGGRES
jgi:demethylmenaquinone methyltransferase / 2-methoxy-6-polyprenyl-1,4-benzoquinol methylase